jgi:hypothetical protein
MKLNPAEGQGGVTWLLCAGAAAVALSAILFWTDTEVMFEAPARDRAHAAKMRELRMAQASVAAPANDPRVTMPLKIDSQAGVVIPEGEAHSSDGVSH